MLRQSFDRYEIKRRFALDRQLLVAQMAYLAEEDLLDFLEQEKKALDPGQTLNVEDVYRKWREEDGRIRLWRITRKALEMGIDE